MTDRAPSPEVEAYIARLSEPARGMLEKILTVIRSVVPEAQEVISYGIPTFKLDGNLVHYAAFKNHCSFFPGGIAQSDAFRDELADYKLSKGTIQFTADNPLPDDLVRRIVLLRVEQNRHAALTKKTGKKSTSTASSGS